ncbi:MAG: hypothetical protein WC156_05980, partial [Pedobacter sp.]
MSTVKDWIEARKKFRLSDMHIQMARELGINPRKFGSLANHKQEKWKSPLPEFTFPDPAGNRLGTLYQRVDHFCPGFGVAELL